MITSFLLGATDRIRTGDLLITNQLLCQLSHSSIYEGAELAAPFLCIAY